MTSCSKNVLSVRFRTVGLQPPIGTMGRITILPIIARYPSRYPSANVVWVLFPVLMRLISLFSWFTCVRTFFTYGTIIISVSWLCPTTRLGYHNTVIQRSSVSHFHHPSFLLLGDLTHRSRMAFKWGFKMDIVDSCHVFESLKCHGEWIANWSWSWAFIPWWNTNPQTLVRFQKTLHFVCIIYFFSD